MSTNTPLTDLNIEHSTRPDDRRMEVLVNGLTLWGGTPLAKNTALVSALTRDGQPRRRAGRFARAALQDARRRKERTCPELIGSRRCRPVVLRTETGGPMESKNIYVCHTSGPTTTTIANITSSSPHLPRNRFAQPCRPPCTPSRPACSPKIVPTTGTWKERTLPQPGAPRHLSTPPIGPTEPKQPGNRPVQQSYCSEPCGEKTKTRKNIDKNKIKRFPPLLVFSTAHPIPTSF